MADKKDYYETLEVSKSAGDEDLKKAYRRLAKKYHPDANPGDAEAEARFKELSEAYAVLSDPQKRAAYDQYGHAAFDGAAGGGGGGFYGNVDISDIFESVFGGGFGDMFGGGRSRRAGPRKGSDVHTNVQIEFEDAVFGGSKDVRIQLNEKCDVCKGTGAKPGTTAETCRNCNGTGQERVQQQTIFGFGVTVRACSVCRGEGKVVKEPCPACRGGLKRVEKTLQVTIPKGIESGQSLRLTGKGEPGERGGPYGDLLITIHIKPHKFFVRQGQNIYLDVPITFVQAALGAEITIPTLEGEEKYTIKPGTQTGASVTLRGKGVPSIRNNRIVGDLIAKLNVTIPTQLSDKQKQLLYAFADEMGDEFKDHKKGFFDKLQDMFK